MKKKTKVGLIVGLVALVCVVAIVLIFVFPSSRDDVHEHVLTHNDAVAATCTENGTVGYWSCDECGKNFVDKDATQELDSIVVPALGHDVGDYEVEKSATCVDAGIEIATCSRCGNEQSRTIEALGHDWNDGIVTTPATCSQTGVMTFSCSRCTETKTEDINVLGHDYIEHDGKVPTCTEPGWEDYVTCSRCDYTTYHALPAAGHDAEVIPAVDATCTKDGLTTGQTCSVCGEILVQQEVIQAPGHIPVTLTEEKPTCTSTGLTEGQKCSVCNEILVEQQVVAMIAHSYSADWSNNGDEHWHACISCGATADIAAHIPDRDQPGENDPVKCTICEYIIEPATGHVVHTAGEKWFSDGANHWLTCIGCGIKMNESAHSGSLATCISKAQCTVCNAQYGELAAHSPETVPAVAPTCTKTGLTEGQRCSVCGEIIMKQEIVPANGHTIEIIAAVDPSCTETGLTEGSKCSICGTVIRQQTIIPELGHKPITIPAVDPTCTATGLTAGQKCLVCGTVLAEQEIVPAKNHSYTESILKQPTCTQEGACTYTCAACGDQYTKAISALGHDYIEIEQSAATCVDNGYVLYRCAVCNDEEIVIQYASGHAISRVDSSAEPTCVASGYTSGYCDICGQYITTETPATGHTDSETYYTGEYCGTQKIGYTRCTQCGEIIASFGHSYKVTITQATCTNDGRRSYKCQNCGNSYSETIPAFGHIGGEWIETVPADCKQKGVETQYCIVCGNIVQTRSTALKQHTYKSAVSQGRITYTCTICSDSYYIETAEYITIRFVSNGGTKYEDLEVEKEIPVELPEPTKEGYVFAGWYLDEDLINPCDSSPVFYTDTYLYAAWYLSTLTGDINTNNIITDVPLTYTFRVESEVALTDSNLSKYIFIEDLNAESPEIYIASRQGNIYTIAGRNYQRGMSYDVIIRDALNFVDASGNELWFITEKENSANISYQTDVVFIPEYDVYSIYEQGEDAYILFRTDLLDVGDVAVIYGETRQDVLLAFEVIAEGHAEGAHLYGIEAADFEDVFAEYDVYYSGELDIQNVEFESDLTEELTARVLASPMYAQFESAASTFSTGVTVGNYYYDFNGITVKPLFSAKNSKIVFSISVIAEFARMETTTYKVDSILQIILEIKSVLSFNTTADVDSVNNFVFVLDVKNTTTANLYVSTGVNETSSKELNYFKTLFLKAKDEGKYSELDASSANSSKETRIGTAAVPFYGLTFRFDISNVFNFSVVGQLGVSSQVDLTASFGVQRVRGNFSTIKSFQASASVSFYMLGKIEISDLIKLKATVSLFGIVNAYIDCGFGPYFTVGGMFTASAHSGGGHNTISGGYLEIGIKVNSNVRISIKILWWPEWTWERELYSNNFSLFSLGEKEVPLYFTDVSEDLTAEYSCGTPFDVSSIINLNAVLQDMSSMKTSTKELECSYYLDGDYPGFTLTEDGALTIPSTDQDEITVCIKVVSGNIHKYAQITFTVKHNEQLSAYQAPTCTQPGMMEYTYCTSCGEVLSGEKTMIAAKGHTYVASVTKEPSCNREGEMTYTCSVCGGSYTESIPTIAHTEVIDEAVAPSCIKTGLTEGKHCSVCGTVLVAQEVVPMAEHSYVNGVCTMCGAPEPQPSTEGLVFTRSDDGTQYSVTGYTGTATEVYIPAVYEGLPVTSIGSFAFSCCSSLTSIAIPDSVTSIESYAFDSCSSLTSIAIPDSVTSIESYAFYGCKALTSIEIPDSVTSIESCAFYGCKALTSIAIPDSVTNIGSSAFAYCSSLTSVTIDGSVIIIESYTFDSCSSLTSLTIPDSVTIIGEYAFYGCEALTSITIPDSVTSIGQSAFYGCEALTSLTIPDSVTGIGRGAFWNCDSLASITVASGNTIYHSAGNCIIETESQTLIAGCNNSVIPTDGSVTSIGWYAFQYCNSLTSIMIPDTVTSIGSSAFSSCSSLTSITIPDSVTSIGSYVFENCDNLASITVASGNTIYHSAGNCIIETESQTLIAGCNNSVIPTDGSVASIGNYAFRGCSGLTSITIPNSVTSIGNYAFYRCDSLTSITIPDGVTSIGDYAFQYCSSLTSIEIPDSVTSIGQSAFAYCSSLTSIKIPNGVTWIGSGEFQYCSSLTSIEIPDSVTSIGSSAFSGCSSLESITIPDSVTSIGIFAFSGCSSLESITIPDSVTSIGSSAFSGCSSLTSMTFANTNGWLCVTSSWATSGTSISSVDLSDPSTAATYLRSTYFNYYWKRS